jgi:FAD/FMN-containing dehydrogenase
MSITGAMPEPGIVDDVVGRVEVGPGTATDRPGLSRRDLLRLGGMGLASLVAAGCSSSHTAGGPSPSATASSPSSAPVPSTVPVVTDVEWTNLGRSLTGRLVRPSDPGYLTDLRLYDSRFDSIRPMGIAYCASVSDVQRSVEFARVHGVPFAVRSGGHSYAGYSTSTGLIIDVTPMATVATGPGTTTIGAGARLIDVYTPLNNSGVSIPAGSCPTVGLAGLTLGGGVGVVDRAYGLTCDAMSSVVIVTADSRAVTANATTDSDLYWACRGGGGGNFGVATTFTYQTFPTSPLTLVFLTWPWAAASDVVPAWLSWAPGAPDQLWSNLLLMAEPAAGSPTLQVGVVWMGPPSGVEAPLARLFSAVGSPPSRRPTETVPFGHAMYVEGGCASLSQAACHLPSQTAGGALLRQPSLAKSGYFSAPLGDAGVAALISGIAGRQAAGGQGAVGIDAYGGAINRVDAAATAFVHRSALASAQYNVPFQPGTPTAQLGASQAWLDSWYNIMIPHMNGSAYQNYIDPALPDWAHAYYGTNLPRLMQVKKAFDPDNIFHFAQSIPPA